jgi:hypothetical protein
MAPIVVDPEALAGAGESVSAVDEEIGAAVNALASALAGGAPTGLDDAGLAFGISYQKSAQALLDAAEAAVEAGRGIGFGVQMSATNYSRADAASTVGGGASPLTAPTAPGEFSAPACPPSLGGAVPAPFLWGMVQMFIPDVWPDGDPSRLQAAATAWDTFATAISGVPGEFAAPSGVIGAQHIPEGGNMTSAISELSQSLSQVASEAGKLATQTREFADDVAHTQNTIRDLLDRVSPSGFLDGIKAVLSGDALEELKEIAEDIKTVLGGFGRQVEGRTQLLQQLIDWIDGSVVSMQKWARKEFTHYLGEDVGGPCGKRVRVPDECRRGVHQGGDRVDPEHRAVGSDAVRVRLRRGEGDVGCAGGHSEVRRPDVCTDASDRRLRARQGHAEWPCTCRRLACRSPRAGGRGPRVRGRHLRHGCRRCQVGDQGCRRGGGDGS